MAEEPSEAATFVMLQVATWIRGTIAQAESLLAAHSKLSDSDEIDRMATVIEEEFLVVAARKLVRWTTEATRLNLLASGAFPELEVLKKLIVDVRDMREHADDYIVRQEGKKQSEFHYAPQDDAGNITYSSDATATMVLDGSYLIGGRLSVQAILVAAAAARKSFLTVIQDSEFSWITLK
jgi:hypothetical protein